MPGTIEIDEDLKREVVGARRQIVFVEGEDDTSLDKPLYSIVFPEVSVRSKGTAREVQQAVEGIRATGTLHWVRPFGIIDRDGRTPEEIEALELVGVYALPFYSVESIYYHPELIRRLAERHAQVVGGDAEAKVGAALAAGIQAVMPQLGRLSARAVEKSIRGQVFAALPSMESITRRESVDVAIDTGAIVDYEVQKLTDAATRGDWLEIVTYCPIRETPARDAIARAIGLKARWQYEDAIMQMLRTDSEALAAVRSWFGALPSALGH